jgi:hypothetical protein
LILGILVIPTILFLFFMIKDPDFVNSGKINWHKIFNRRN